jgi:hypothetical protein
VAQGFGIFSLTGILIDAAHNYFGTHKGADTFRLLSQMQNGLYVVCLTYWIVTLALNEPVPQKMPEELHNELRALQSKITRVLTSMRKMGKD